VHNALGLLLVVMLTACVSTGGQPKASQPAAYTSEKVAALARHGSTEPVVIAAEVAEGFQFLYRFVEETEFVLCLEGNHSRGRIYITGFRLARMKTTSLHRVAYENCDNRDYVGTAHNHPPTDAGALCYQSVADQKSFSLDMRAQVDIVLCGENRLLWVLKDGRSRIENGARGM
jgi:hypothetical protein